jgi:hypothetical protein
MPLNDTNEECNRCGKPTIPLWEKSRKRWCPDCEGEKKDLIPIGSKCDRDEVTHKCDDCKGGCSSHDDPYGFQIIDLPELKRNKKI